MDDMLPDDDRTVLRPGAQPARGGLAPDPGAVAVTVTTPVPAPVPFTPAPAAKADEGNALPVGTQLAEFELLSVIGEGGFGIVYLALDQSLQRRVAIKEYMPQTLAKRDQTTVSVRNARHQDSFQAGLNSFINEAKLLAQFDHPALVKVHRFWKANGTAYMVMPLYSGPTLREELKRRRPGAAQGYEAWLLELLDALTQALAVMHADNCFHRDIAPDNILLLEGSGKPLLLDFGAARTVIGDMTQSLTVILKPGYAPIEQYAEVADMKQGAWTDVYALASSVHFAIRGSTPPPAVGRLVNDSYVTMQRMPPPGYSPQFLAAIDHALQVRPENRTQSMNAFRLELGLPALGSAAASGVGEQRTQQPTQNTVAPAVTAQRQNDAYEATRLQTPVGALQPANAAPAARQRLPLIAAGVAVLAGAAAFMYWQFGQAGPAAQTAQPAVPAQASVAAAAAPAPAVQPAALAAQTATVPTAAASAAAPAAAAPAGVPKTVQAQLEDVLAAQTPGFAVSASPVRPSFRVDRDKLSFSLSSSRDGYVQVLWLNAEGKLTVLFPNALVAKVRIKAGQTLTLPPKQMELLAAKPEGRENFLVLVSQQPRDFSSLAPKQVDGFTQLTVDASRSVGEAGQPLLAGGAGPCAGPGCQEYGAALFGIEVVH